MLEVQFVHFVYYVRSVLCANAKYTDVNYIGDRILVLERHPFRYQPPPWRTTEPACCMAFPGKAHSTLIAYSGQSLSMSVSHTHATLDPAGSQIASFAERRQTYKF